MNHIHRLQHERDAAQGRLRATTEALQSFRVHLLGPKFQGCEADGGRKDWIAVGDVFRWLRTIETAGEDNEQEAASRAGRAS